MLMSMKHALLLCWVTTVCSYRTGAPGSDIVCRAMFPVGHGHEAQTGPAPYTISVSTTVFFDAYDKVQVMVAAQTGFYFRGLFLQARRANCSHPLQQEPTGVFMLPEGEYLQHRDCFGRADSAVTHTSYTAKTPQSSVVVQWLVPPAAEVDGIYFLATIVKEQDTFWTNVASETVRRHDSPYPPAHSCLNKTLTHPPNSASAPYRIVADDGGKTTVGNSALDSARVATSTFVLGFILVYEFT